MEKPVIPSCSLTDLEVAAKQDVMILHVQDGESAKPVVLLASRTILSAQSSVLAARLAEAAPDEARLRVTAPPMPFQRLYTMMQDIAVTTGGADSQNGTHQRTLVLITSADLDTTLPLAVQFGASGVVGCIVEGVQQAPSMDGIYAVDRWVPDDGPFGGFAWRRRAADLLVKQCVSCSRKTNDILARSGPHRHTFNWNGLEGGPRRARTLQALLDRVWLSLDSCALTCQRRTN